MFEKFTDKYLNEAKEPVYKKGQRINYQLYFQGGVGKYADAISKSKDVDTGVIRKRTKNKITGSFKYELTNGLELSSDEIVGLAESVDETLILPVNEKPKGKGKRVTKRIWNKLSDDDKVDLLLTVFSDPDDAEEHMEDKWEDLPPVATSNMVIYEAKVTAKTIDKITNQIAKLTKELKDNFALYKKAKTDEEKKEYLTIAGEKTREKRHLDSELEKAIQNFGADMELDMTFENEDLIDSITYAMNEARRGHSSTQFFKGIRAKDGDLFHSKRHGLAVKKGDKLYLFYAWEGEPKLGKVYKTDKLHNHIGPATPELVKTYYGDAEKAMADYANKLEESINEEREFGMFNGDMGKPTKLDKEVLDIVLKALPSKITKNIAEVEGSGAYKRSAISPPTVSNKGQSRGEIEYTTIYIMLDKPMGRNKVQGITVGLRKRTSGPGTGYLYMSVKPDSHHSFGPDAEGAIEFIDDPSYFLQKLYNEKFKNWF